MNAITIFVTCFLVFLTFALPRKYFIVPFILSACFVPTDQRFIIMQLDFTVLRILVAASIFRVILNNEMIPIKWNKFDKVLLVWAFYGALIYSLQWSTLEAVINRLGMLFDVLGLYWLFRQKIRSWDDIKFVIKVLAIGMIILSPFVFIELTTKHNPFSILGRVFTNVREERLRCQAAFPHSIMLGVFCATQIPMFIGIARGQKNKMLYYVAGLAAFFIICATASSTPILVLMVGLFVATGFRWRYLTKYLFITLIVVLIAMHIIMDAPVWHLLSRINVVGGSTGWHRYNLINQAMEHINEWIFIGSRSTAHWGFGLEDVTNQFILEGLRGGFATMAIFIAMIFIGMKSILHLSLKVDDPYKRYLSWCCFVAILTHCFAFFSVSYFGQTTMLWYMMLAVAGLLVEYDNQLVLRPISRPYLINYHPIVSLKENYGSC